MLALHRSPEGNQSSWRRRIHEWKDAGLHYIYCLYCKYCIFCLWRLYCRYSICRICCVYWIYSIYRIYCIYCFCCIYYMYCVCSVFSVYRLYIRYVKKKVETTAGSLGTWSEFSFVPPSPGRRASEGFCDKIGETQVEPPKPAESEFERKWREQKKGGAIH